MVGPPIWHEWLCGLADLGCTFVELVPNEKRTRLEWNAYIKAKGARGLRMAHQWLSKASGVGILPKPPLWILDADSASEVERIVSICIDAQVAPLIVRTPSGGAHFYFLMPETFPREGLKNHLCHPMNTNGLRMTADFKFGPQTLLVAPGTSRNGRDYIPDQSWSMPPVADPRIFLPKGQFWKVHPHFLVDARPLKDRLYRARVYLANRAPVSVSGKSGRQALAGVCTHLVVFLGLDPGTANHLLTHGEPSWNDRCIDIRGNCFPWSSADLFNACSAAVGSIPAAGVKAWERAQVANAARRILDELVGCLQQSMTLPQSTRVPVERVRRLFAWFGCQELSSKRLGDALSKRGITRIQAKGGRVQCVPMLDYRAVVNASLCLKEQELTRKLGMESCALIQHQSSLEENVSEDFGANNT